MATSTIKLDNTNVQSATLSSGFSGNVHYVRDGRVVTVNLVVSSTSALTAGQTFATGMPQPYEAYTLGLYMPFGMTSGIRLTDSGTLTIDSAQSAGSRTFRTSFSYISQL